MLCPKCGAMLRDDAKFCTRCGALIERAASSESSFQHAETTPAQTSQAADSQHAANVPNTVQSQPQPAGQAERPKPDAAAQQPDQPPRVPQQPQEHASLVSRRAVLAGLGIVAAGGAAALVTNRLGLWRATAPEEQVGGEDVQDASDAEGLARVAFGSRATVQLTDDGARIEPQTTGGEAIPSYTVRVRSAADTAGADIDVFGLQPLEVQDDGSGFCLRDMGASQPGTWELTVTPEDADPLWLPPLELIDADAEQPSADAAEELVVLPANELDDADATSPQGDETTPRLGKWAALLKVAREAQRAHGEAAVRTSSDTYSSYVWLDGLCIVRLIDFGDGDTRLLLAYPAQDVSQFPTGGTGTYTVELWRYDAEADAATLELSLGSGFTNGGQRILYFSEVERDGVTYRYVTQTYDGDAGERVYGLADDGSVGQVCEVTYDYGSMAYLVNGAEVDQSTYTDTLWAYALTLGSGGLTTYILASPQPWQDEGGTWPEQIVQEAQDTLARLEGIASDVLDGWLAQTDGENADSGPDADTATGSTVSSDADTATGDATSTAALSPFWGIWVVASKDEADCARVVDDLRSQGFDAATYVTTDWSNLNTEAWYVVSAGAYASQADAEAALPDVRGAGYADAYVKYSGDHR